MEVLQLLEVEGPGLVKTEGYNPKEPSAGAQKKKIPVKFQGHKTLLFKSELQYIERGMLHSQKPPGLRVVNRSERSADNGK